MLFAEGFGTVWDCAALVVKKRSDLQANVSIAVLVSTISYYTEDDTRIGLRIRRLLLYDGLCA